MQKFFTKYKIIFIIIGLIVVSLLLRSLILNINVELIRTFFASLGIIAPLFYILIFALDEVIPGGSSINAILFYAAGFIFRPELAIVYTLTADFIGTTINFLIARYKGLSLLKRILNRKQLDILIDFTKTIDWELIFLFRLIPFVTTLGVDIVSYAAGLSRIRYITFILATLIPWAIIDAIQFYAINLSVKFANPLFLLPVYLILTIPLTILILRKEKRYRHYFKEFYDRLTFLKRFIDKIKSYIKR